MSRRDRGANLLEYVGIVIIVSAVVVALGAVLLPVDSSLRRAVCQVIQVCDDGSGQAGEQGEGPGGEGGPGDGDGENGNGGPAAGPGGGEPESPGPSRWDCWDWVQWGCDATKGLVDGTVDAVVGLWDGVTFVGCMVHICSHDAFKETWGGIGKLFTDPVESLKTIWDESTKPIRDRWNNGDYVGAVFYTVPAIVGTIFGGKGINKLGKIGKADGDGGGGGNIPDGKTLAGNAKKAADDAEQAASRADPKAAKTAADEAEQAAKDAEQKAKDDPTPENQQAAKDARAEANRAAKALKDAEVRAVMNDSALGKEANAVINQYNVKIEYRKGGGTVYDPQRNTMIIDETMTPDKASQAPYIIHEVNHAKWRHEGRSADINGSRADYVRDALREEAEGTSKQIEASKELRTKGHNTPQQPLEANYDAAYNRAIQNGQSVTDARAAGRQAVQDAFNKGQVRTSNTNDPYPDYYGKGWDRHHGKTP